MSDNISSLRKISDLLLSDTGLTPHIASELEFYLEGVAPHIIEAMFPDCYRRLGAAGILTHEIEEESAEEQFEISLVHLPDPLSAAHNTITAKDIIISTASEYGITANFAAKPYEDRPGNGLHIHVSLHNKSGINLFQKEAKEDNEESYILRQAVAGLCATMSESMVFFAPNDESYKRYTAEPNDSSATYNNAPVNISWGGNNRTVAIRIPTSTLYPESRHLEHRVAGTDADPYMLIAVILAGIDYGLKNELPLEIEKIWGNAFDAQYELTGLPKNLSEAKNAYKNGKIIKEYLD